MLEISSEDKTALATSCEDEYVLVTSCKAGSEAVENMGDVIVAAMSVEIEKPDDTREARSVFADTNNVL